MAGSNVRAFGYHPLSMVVCTTTVSKLLRQILIRQQYQFQSSKEKSLYKKQQQYFTIATLTQQAQKHHFQNVWLKKKLSEKRNLEI